MPPSVDIDIHKKPNLIRAWFDTVIQPILSGLFGEERLLEKGDYTYRHHPEELTFFSRTEDLAMAGATPNFVQFCEVYAEELLNPIQAHDSAVDQLFHRCRDLHRALISSGDFQTTYDRCVALAASQAGGDANSLFGAIQPEGERRAIVAEYIVNNVLRLGNHDATGKLWNPYRSEFLKVKETGEVRPFVIGIEDASRNLQLSIRRLRSVLEQLRKDLSIENDVPIVLPREV